MSTMEAAYKYKKLAIAGVLASFLAVPAMADDYGQPAGQQAASPESSSEQAEDRQPEQQREPTYVWQGNHYKGQDRGEADATHASVPETSYAEAHAGTIVVPTTDNLPKAQEANGVQFITGGIGDEERNALDAVKGQYSLHVTSSNKNGEFDGDTEVTVLDKKGNKVISVTGGPIFFINLPAGGYELQASSGGRTEKQKIAIGGKPSSAYFRW